MSRTSLNQWMAEANAAVPRITADEARRLQAEGALVVDVREPNELAQTGQVPGAVAVPRGLLEFRADPGSPSHDPRFDPGKPVVLYCASGGRSALAGKTLRDMGYGKVFNLGGFQDWVAAGGAVERAG